MWNGQQGGTIEVSQIVVLMNYIFELLCGSLYKTLLNVLSCSSKNCFVACT